MIALHSIYLKKQALPKWLRRIKPAHISKSAIWRQFTTIQWLACIICKSFIVFGSLNTMKVMLVFPPLSAQERYGKHTTNLGSLTPLGLCYMAAVLEKAGHTVKITDCPVNGFTLEDVKKDIAEFSPDWVGLSAITSLVARASELCAMIRKDFPNIKILVGGSHATVMPEETLALSGADIVISGECEDVLVDIIEHPERFPKIVRCAPVRDLDSLPFPARHLLDMSKYTSLPNNYKRSPNVFQVFATRGCPYVCTFC